MSAWAAVAGAGEGFIAAPGIIKGMAATLVARDLAAGHGDRALFSGLNLVVAPGDVVGLVGVNGAGKSTLLGLLAGLAEPEHGTVRLDPPTATIGYLPQEPQRRPGRGDLLSGGRDGTGRRDLLSGGRDGTGETVRAFIGRRTGVMAAHDELDRTAKALAEEVPGAGPDGRSASSRVEDAYAHALERWLSLGAADLDQRLAAVAADLGLAVDLDAPMTSLSGGQAARAGLASLLLSRYDVFLLDEPTNDLDLDGLDRLERFIGDLSAGTVVVSHDREFLTRTVTSVLELDLAQQQVRLYGGGYEAYLEERGVARRHAREAYDEYAQTLAGLRERARIQRAWMDKGVRNALRKSKDPDKNVRHFQAETSEKQAAKAAQTDRLIERLDTVEEPRKEWQLRMQIAAAPRAGAVVAALRDAVVSRGDFTLGPVDLQIDWADKVAIVGPNGSGKSTLLGALLGRLPLAAGAASLGPGVVVGEVDQARGLFLGDQPLAAAFGAAVPEWSDADVRTLLAKFGLRAAQAVRPAATLSPGERTRAALALLQARGVNLLVLDEPTNHLDLPAIVQLESALADYQGTLLLVTHDRRMLEQVSTNRRVTVADGHVTEA